MFYIKLLRNIISLCPMNTNSIKLLINYSRSGGTLISRVLSSLPNVVLLSEVNPNQNSVPYLDVAYQMKQWYNLDVAGNTYLEKIEFIYNWCNNNNKILIVRDYSAFDFLPNPVNLFSPKGSLENYKLLHSHFPIQTICFVRDAFDVWISRDCPPQFSNYYCQYVSSILQLNVPIFKYEDFCLNPSVQLKMICEELNLNYDEKVLKSYKDNHKITGDNLFDIPSRGIKMGEIKPLKRKRIAVYLQNKINKDENMQQLNLMLNYPITYKNEYYFYEEKPSKIWVELKFWIRKLTNKYPKHLY